MEYWIVVGRELIQNKLSHLIVKSNRGGFQRLTPHQLEAFTKKNKVVNIKSTSVNTSLTKLPLCQ